MSALSNQQIAFFRMAGYLRLPFLLPITLREAVRVALEEIVREPVGPCVRDSFGKVIRVSRLIERGDVFRSVFVFSELLDALESLLGPNIELLRNRHNHATFNENNTLPLRLHRDVLQWSRNVVTALVYLDDATESNGCTHVIPASQYLPFVGTPNNGGTWMDEHSIFADLLGQSVPVPMRAGGVLLIDSLAFHSVGLNSSGMSRVVLSAAYHSVDELNTQDGHHRELVRGARIYRGNDYL